MDLQAWTAWSARIVQDWTAPLQDAWEDAVEAARGIVEGDEAGARARATEFYGLLFGDDGLYAHLGAMRAHESALSPTALDTTRAAIATRLGVPAEEVTADAFGQVLYDLSLGFLKDARYASSEAPSDASAHPRGALPRGAHHPGMLPLLIGGLIIGIGGLCWVTVRREQALVEMNRIRLARAMLQSADEASRDGREVDLDAIGAVGRPADASPLVDARGTGGGLLLGLAGAALLGGGLIWALGRRA